MTRATRPTDSELSEFIDGGLDQQRRSEIAVWLRMHPEKAAEIERLGRLNDALKGLGAEILEEPVPDRLRRILRAAPSSGDGGGAAPGTDDPRRADAGRPASRNGKGGAPEPDRPGRSSARAWPRFVEAAAVLLVFVLGGAIGWSLRSYLDRELSSFEQVMADASHAYAFYTADRNYPIEFPPEQGAAFEAIMGKLSRHAVRPPDLQTVGYRYRGARLAPTARTTATFFFFEDAVGRQVMVLSWPADTTPALGSGLLDRDGVAVRFWSSGGLGFAVFGREFSGHLADVFDAVESFYREARSSG